MALDSDNVRVAVTGEVMVGATSASAPTGTGGSTTGFAGLGYVSEEGVVESRDRSADSIRAWQNGANVRTVVSDSSLTYAFTLLETTVDTIELFYGADVTQAVSEGHFVIDSSTMGGRKSFIIDVVDGDELLRVYIPTGEVTSVSDVTYSNGSPISFSVVITAYENTGISGNAKVWATALKS